MADLDHFKEINDTLGHLVGDRVLKEVAHRIATSVRDKDLIGRYGGEEFLLIFPATSLRVAKQVAERIRRHVGSTPIHLPEHSIPITISIGLTYFNRADTLESLLQRADSAMYAAKQAGRDCVTVA
jgi:diguanylate cyclase (GGDEF)-like protein